MLWPGTSWAPTSLTLCVIFLPWAAALFYLCVGQPVLCWSFAVAYLHNAVAPPSPRRFAPPVADGCSIAPAQILRARD